MRKCMLIVSAGVEAVPGILHAKSLGLEVVAVDGDARAPGLELADHTLIASTYDADAVVSAAERFINDVRPIDGALCIAADVPVTVARVAEALGLPGLPLETARLSADKVAMKATLLDAGIPVPWFAEIGSSEGLRDICESRGMPLVVKPVDSRGARGVLRLTEEVDPDWAFAHSHSHSPSGRVMVEEYLEGPQVSTESVLLESGAATVGFSDRNYEFVDRFAPWLIENGGQQPTHLSDGDRAEVARVAEAAGRALGVVAGTVKGDMVLTDKGPYVIEVATRLSGGWFCTDQIPLATGVDLLGAAFDIALGKDVALDDLQPRISRGVSIRYFFPEPGRVLEAPDLAEWESLPWVHRIALSLREGEAVAPASDHTKRAGFVLTTGETAAEAVSRGKAVVEQVESRIRLA